MTKREEIEALKGLVAALTASVDALSRRLTELDAVALRRSPSPLDSIGKSYSEIQKDWAERNNGALAQQAPNIKDLTKGPLPYAHKTGHVGKMTVGDNGG